MKFYPEYDTLVIVGSWNNAIITPDWISKYLITDDELKVQYPMIGDASLRITTDELRLYVSQGRFNFSILKHEDLVYLKIGDTALKLANYLMHTPVTSFGLNFVYESEPNDDLDKYFTLNDSQKISDCDLEEKTTLIKRSFGGTDPIQSLTVTKDKKYKFDFNYHFDIGTLVNFKDKFRSKDLLKFKERSTQLLSDLYDLEME